MIDIGQPVMSGRIGIDVGGTFTDAVYLKNGQLHRGKADTTHYDLKVGLMNAIKLAAEQAGSSLKDVLRDADAIIYSTTVGTNALIERKGAKLGLITTKGFEHTVYVGRARNWGDGLPTARKYDRGRAVRPAPIIPQDLIVGVQERIDNLGNVIIPMRDSDVREKIQYLVDRGVRGFVIVMLNSFVNPAHELRIAELISEQYPESFLGHMPVYMSHAISPKSGEYRRSMTVIIDAYLRDITEGHVLRLSDELRSLGYRRPLFVAKNTGGLSSLSRTQALHLLSSSPAATVIGSGFVGDAIGASNIVVSDMGGTSFDVGLVMKGRDRVYEFDPVIDRFRVQIPYVAQWSIGAGGGSIAKLVNGILTVGPESAGSNPGPACYGRGGEEPTVTDADLLLGYMNPDNFLGGTRKLDRERAEKAIQTKIAAPLGISVIDAAWDIKRLVDGYMGQEMHRICALMSGQDPRDFILFALGGAGPVHAAGYAEGVDITRVATFPYSSVFGAFSTLTMDILQTYERTLHLTMHSHRSGRYASENIATFNVEAKKLLDFAQRDMTEEGFDLSALQMELQVHMCYGQQRQTLPIALRKTTLDSENDLAILCEEFNKAYAEKYGKGACYPEAGIEMTELRLNVIGPVGKYKIEKAKKDPGGEKSLVGHRKAYWGPKHGFLDTPIYRRESMGAGVKVDGPVICEAPDTVIVTPPNWRFRVDDFGVGWMEKIANGGE